MPVRAVRLRGEQFDIVSPTLLNSNALPGELAQGQPDVLTIIDCGTQPVAAEENNPGHEGHPLGNGYVQVRNGYGTALVYPMSCCWPVPSVFITQISNGVRGASRVS